LFLQIPNRMLNFVAHPSRTNTTVPLPTPSQEPRVLGVPAVAGSDWPVSPPTSTPPPQSGGAGYWTGFRSSGSFERR